MRVRKNNRVSLYEPPFGMGRLYIPDVRDQLFPMSKALGTVSEELPEFKYWFSGGWWGDQGQTPKCVGYCFAHLIEDGPVGHKGPAPIIPPDDMYAGAQANDEWPGEDYEGSSGRGAAKWLQGNGKIGPYFWANDIDSINLALLTKGPVPVGTYWHDDMFSPDSNGEIKVSGPIAGGHEYLLNGIDTRREIYRIKNSWGREWGKKGFAIIKWTEFEKLLKNDGDAMLITELKF